MEKSRIQKRVWLLFAIFIGINLATIIYDQKTLRASLIEEKATQTRHLVDSAQKVVAHFHRLSQQGLLNEATAQKAARETLRAMRYGDNDYFWINDLGQPYPRMVMHPMHPELEGRSLDAPEYNTASRIRFGNANVAEATAGQENLFQAFVRVVQDSGHGYVYYRWPKPAKDGAEEARLFDKVSFVQGFQPWGWVVGSGIYLDEIDQEITTRTLWHLALALILFAAIAGITFYLARDIRRIERSIHSSRTAMQALIDTTPESMLLLDEQGNIQAINHFGAQRFNQTPAALLGKNFYAMIPPALAQTRSEACRQVIATGEPLTIKDERSGIFFENNIYPVLNSSGKAVAVAVCAKDVTLERRIRATDEMFRHVDSVLLKWQMGAETVAQIFCDHILSIYKLSAVWIGRCNKDCTISSFAQAETPECTLLAGSQPPLTWCSTDAPWPYIAQALQKENPHASPLDASALGSHAHAARQSGILGALVLPLVVQGKTWGALTIYSDSMARLEADQARLISVGHRLALSLESAIQQEWLSLLNTALVNVNTAVLITDARPRILWANRAAASLTGYSQEELLDQPTTLLSADHNPDTARKIADWTRQGNAWNGEHLFRHKDGHCYTVQLSLSPLIGSGGSLSHYIAVMEDISERKEEEAKVIQMAYFDTLTGLPNRALIMDRLHHAIGLAGRTGHPGAALFIDLDLFKEINDQHGHGAGDEVLRTVAHRLRHHIREIDTVGRLGGDEFIVILSELSSGADAQRLAENLLQCFNDPIPYLGQPLKVGASIGYALFSDHGRSENEIIQAADDAMYQAKQAGRSRVHGPVGG